MTKKHRNEEHCNLNRLTNGLTRATGVLPVPIAPVSKRR